VGWEARYFFCGRARRKLRGDYSRRKAAREEYVFKATVASACGFAAASDFLGGREKGGGEFFVEGEEVFDALAVVVEGLRTITEVDGAVEFGVGFDEGWRHGERIVKVGESGIGEFLACVEDRLQARSSVFLQQG
jgi:hypothetical protein